MTLINKVRDTIKKYQLVRRGDKILVGISGGPDSVALLYILNNLKNELKISLHAAHLDHMLRRGSSKDREFVERFCAKLRVPLTCGQINVRAMAQKGSVEEIARNARLGFLFKVARKVKGTRIALGHHLDDQAETVLMRILRGTGLYGLGGMLPEKEIKGFKIIRPLIEVRRKEIGAFLRQKRLKPILDTSNLQNVYFRNKIRNKLFPFLEREFSRTIKEVLSRLAETSAVDYEFLNACAQRSLRAVTKSKCQIHLKKFSRLHLSLQRLVLRLSVAKLKGDLRRLTFKHLQEIEDLILNRPVHSIVDLPQGVSVIKKRATIAFRKK
jgi:tRNA(Ile)-lysidine synthase